MASKDDEAGQLRQLMMMIGLTRQEVHQTGRHLLDSYSDLEETVPCHCFEHFIKSHEIENCNTVGHILVYGECGMGKSSLCRHITQTWEREQSKLSERCYFIFPTPMRDTDLRSQPLRFDFVFERWLIHENYSLQQRVEDELDLAFKFFDAHNELFRRNDEGNEKIKAPLLNKSQQYSWYRYSRNVESIYPALGFSFCWSDTKLKSKREEGDQPFPSHYTHLHNNLLKKNKKNNESCPRTIKESPSLNVLRYRFMTEGILHAYTRRPVKLHDDCEHFWWFSVTAQTTAEAAVPRLIRSYERLLNKATTSSRVECMAIAWLVLLLLTLANDVETNPGPIGGAMASQGDLCILKIPATIHIQTPEARSKRQSSPSVGKIRNEVVTQTNKTDSPLRKQLFEYYGLTLLSAKDGFKENNMEFSFRNRTRKDGEKLVKELEYTTFGRLVSSLLKLHPAPKSWELIPSVDKEKSEYYLSRCPQQDSGFCEDEVEGRSPSSPTEQTTDLYGAAGSGMKSPSFTPAAEMVPPPSRVQSSSLPPESRKFQEPLLPGISGSPVTMPARVSSPFAVINKVSIELLKSKKHTEYDLHQMLKTHSKQIVPLLMLDENGFNMLHQCVEQNRIPLLKVFHVHGYWAELIEQEVPRGSSSEFAGCTPRQMAERKRLRRVVKELERITQQEKSMDGKNASLRVSRSGNVELLRQMKASGNADMKAKDSEENNAVHWAATSGSLEAVKYLTRELNIRPDLKNEIKQTPLHLAVIYGQSSVVSFLAVECKLDAKATDKSEKTPLQRTAENGDTSTLSELLKCNVEIDTSLGVIAAQFGRQNYLQHVLSSYGIDHLYRNNEGKTCLMVAAESGHLEIVKFLLNTYNYNLNDVSNQRRNVFHYAADKGHADVAKFLLEKGRSLGLIPEILNRKDLHRVEQLCSLVRGIDKGRAAWHYVKLKRKYVHLFQKCTKGGRVDASKVGTILQSGWGQEPDLEILKKAVERYKETGRTTEGQEDLTPLLLAVAKGHVDVAKLYIEAGGNVHTRDCFGQTGMHLCAMRGTLETAAALDIAGLELSGQDDEGDQPIRTAEMNEHHELVNFFKGEEHLPKIQDFLDNVLPMVREKLNPSKLRDIRHSGNDSVRHVVDTVRGLSIDINQLLKDVGSGPVLEESQAEYIPLPT